MDGGLKRACQWGVPIWSSLCPGPHHVMTPSSHFSPTTPFFIFFPSHCTSHYPSDLICQQYGDIFGSRADSWGHCCNARLVFYCRAWRNTGEHSYGSKLAPAYLVSLDISLTWFVANVTCGSFPARLFDAILEAGVTVSSHNIQRLILALGKVRELHKSLNEDSIRLLAYILLTSDDKAEQERGLHLLLVDLALLILFCRMLADSQIRKTLGTTRTPMRSSPRRNCYYTATNRCPFDISSFRFYIQYFLVKTGM